MNQSSHSVPSRARVLTRTRRDLALRPTADETPAAVAWRERYFQPCAVPGCGLWIAKGYVACAPHYLCIPSDQRALLGAAFRCREQAPDVYALAVEWCRRLLGAS